MKTISLFRILAMGILLSILLLAASPVPAHAARGITLSPTEGAIGTRITITGTEFNKSTSDTDKYAAIYFSSEEASTLDDIGVEVTRYKLVKDGVWLDLEGEFETTFKVPDILDDGSKEEDVESGTYYVYVCHYLGAVIQPRIRAVATFTVTMGEIELSPLRGTVGTLVEVTGIDFPSLKDISFKYDGLSVPIESGSKRTGSAGGFISLIRVPDSTAGTHIITALASETEATANFRVKPEITISPTSGEINTRATVRGTGFGDRTQVDIWFHNIKVATATTSSLGSFSKSFSVPDLGAGAYTVDAEERANVAKARFTVIVPSPPPPPQPLPPEPSPVISISATTGNIGQGLVMGGSGFKAGATVTIKYDNELLTAVTTDANGVFAAAFTIPPSKYGNHTIIVSDGTNTSEVSFAVESTAPPVPTLILPKTEDKVMSPIRFVWQNVTDLSPPVTYTIQIATSSDFSTTSTVLEKKEMTKTEYVLTETERLRLGFVEKPYYWRVMAIDGASNEGNWANPWIFYVVSGGMPTWAIIVMAVLGGIFLLVLGYFIHMKTSTLK